MVYIFGLLQCVFSTAGLLFAYSWKWGSPSFRKTTLIRISPKLEIVVFVGILIQRPCFEFIQSCVNIY
jgi:hypothetical protein